MVAELPVVMNVTVYTREGKVVQSGESRKCDILSVGQPQLAAMGLLWLHFDPCKSWAAYKKVTSLANIFIEVDIKHVCDESFFYDLYVLFLIQRQCWLIL